MNVRMQSHQTHLRFSCVHNFFFLASREHGIMWRGVTNPFMNGREKERERNDHDKSGLSSSLCASTSFKMMITALFFITYYVFLIPDCIDALLTIFSFFFSFVHFIIQRSCKILLFKIINTHKIVGIIFHWAASTATVAVVVVFAVAISYFCSYYCLYLFLLRTRSTFGSFSLLCLWIVCSVWLNVAIFFMFVAAVVLFFSFRLLHWVAYLLYSMCECRHTIKLWLLFSSLQRKKNQPTNRLLSLQSLWLYHIIWSYICERVHSWLLKKKNEK